MAITKTIVQNVSNALGIDYATSNLLRGNNSFVPGEVTASGSDTTLAVGMVMGRVHATGKMVPFTYNASDGSQWPVGLCWMGMDATKTVTDGTTANIEVVNKGRVDQSVINFSGAETLETVVGTARRVKDLLADIGLELVDPQEQFGHANS